MKGFALNFLVYYIFKGEDGCRSGRWPRYWVTYTFNDLKVRTNHHTLRRAKDKILHSEKNGVIVSYTVGKAVKHN